MMKSEYFKCTGCGKCCTGAPGYVWLSDEEIVAMAKLLDISTEEFLTTYTRQVGNKRSLLEVGPENDCIFLREQTFCAVYAARPKQCKTYPFWPSILESVESWNAECGRCEGMTQIKKRA